MTAAAAVAATAVAAAAAAAVDAAARTAAAAVAAVAVAAVAPAGGYSGRCDTYSESERQQLLDAARAAGSGHAGGCRVCVPEVGGVVRACARVGEVATRRQGSGGLEVRCGAPA